MYPGSWWHDASYIKRCAIESLTNNITMDLVYMHSIIEADVMTWNSQSDLFQR